MHNFLSRDGTPPAIYAVGRQEVARYGGRVETGRVTALSRSGERFAVQIGGRAVTARRLLVATGVRDELPQVPGLAERWGVDVLHCPYCHGWEVRGQRIGILATGPGTMHQALLFAGLGHARAPRTQQEHKQAHGLVGCGIRQRERYSLAAVETAPLAADEGQALSLGEGGGHGGPFRDARVGGGFPHAAEVGLAPPPKERNAVRKAIARVGESHGHIG